MILFHLLFMMIPLSEYFWAAGPSPYTLLDFSLTLWTMCLVFGWAQVAKKMAAEIEAEKIYDEANSISNSSPGNSCFKEKTGLAGDPGWLIRHDSLIFWPFKAIYWFSLGLIYSLVDMVIFAIIAYSLYIFAGHSDYFLIKYLQPRMNVMQLKYPGKAEQPVECRMPAIFSAKWLLCCFDSAFIKNHIMIVLISIVAFIIMGYMGLKKEVGRNDPSYANDENTTNRGVNRNRLIYMHIITGACLDACYTILGFAFMWLPHPDPYKVTGTPKPVEA